MVEMCQVVGNRDQLISLLLPLVDQVLNVILIHFQDRYELCFISNIFLFCNVDVVFYVTSGL